MELDVDSGLPYDPLHMADLIPSLSQCFSQTLERFTVVFQDFEESIIEFIDSPVELGFSAVSPLLSFSRLTRVDLNWFCASAIDDAMIQTMARSWPQLEEIYLGTGACWLTPPLITFTGLVHLIQYCHYLHYIAIVFHACLIDNKSEPFSKTIPNEKITTISVGNSPIDVPSAVACQLHTLLPNLYEVYYFHNPSSPFKRRWARVVSFLEVLVEGTEMKQEQAQALEECSLLA